MADGVFEGLFRREGPVKTGCAPRAVSVLVVFLALGTAALVVAGHLAMTA